MVPPTGTNTPPFPPFNTLRLRRRHLLSFSFLLLFLFSSAAASIEALIACLNAQTLEEWLIAVKRMDRRHLEDRCWWRLCHLGCDRLLHHADEVLSKCRRRRVAVAGPSTILMAHDVVSTLVTSEATIHITAEAAIIGNVAPVPPVIVISDDENEPDWDVLMAEEE